MDGCKKKVKKVVDKNKSVLYNITCVSYGNMNSEKYSRGRRGAPAKGVGRATGARVQIPLSPFPFPNDYFFALLYRVKK